MISSLLDEILAFILKKIIEIDQRKTVTNIKQKSKEIIKNGKQKVKLISFFAVFFFFLFLEPLHYEFAAIIISL